MNKIDMGTVSLVLILIQLLFALGFAVASVNDKHKYMRKQTLGIVLNALGLILLILYREELFFGVYLGNSLLLAGYVFFIHGVFELIDVLSNRKFFLFATFLHLTIYFYFVYITNNISARIFIFSVEAGLMSIYFGMKILSYFFKRKYPTLLLLAINSFIYGGFHFFRGLSVLFVNIDSLQVNQYYMKTTFILAIAFNIILYLSVILLATKLALSKLIETNENLEELATIDYLTRAHNSRSVIHHFEVELEKVRRYNRVMSAAIIDIDYFKKVNDIYGHLVGDEVLVEISKIFNDSLKKTDIFGRYGGEEFLIIMPDTPLEKAQFRVELVQTVLKNHNWEYENLSVTFSAGVIEVNETHRKKEVKELLEDADKLLYQAKHNGRDRVEIDFEEDEYSLDY